MSSNINELLTSIIGQLREIAVTESIVGKPVAFGERLVVPVARISVGFGAGGAEGEVKGQSGFGGGGGGGAKIEPVGFIIYDGTNFSFLPTSQRKFEGIIEAIPDLISKIRQMKKDKEPSESGKAPFEKEK